MTHVSSFLRLYPLNINQCLLEYTLISYLFPPLDPLPSAYLTKLTRNAHILYARFFSNQIIIYFRQGRKKSSVSCSASTPPTTTSTTTTSILPHSSGPFTHGVAWSIASTVHATCIPDLSATCIAIGHTLVPTEIPAGIPVKNDIRNMDGFSLGGKYRMPTYIRFISIETPNTTATSTIHCQPTD